MGFLRIREVAERLAVDKRQISSLIRSGALEAVDVSVGKKRKTWRISEEAMERFLEGRKPRPPEPEPRRVRKPVLNGRKRY